MSEDRARKIREIAFMRLTGLRRSRKDPARFLGTAPSMPRFCDHPKVWIAPGNRHVLTIEPFVLRGPEKFNASVEWFLRYRWQVFGFLGGLAVSVPQGSTRLVIASPEVSAGGADILPIVEAIEAVDWGRR